MHKHIHTETHMNKYTESNFWNIYIPRIKRLQGTLMLLTWIWSLDIKIHEDLSTELMQALFARNTWWHCKLAKIKAAQENSSWCYFIPLNVKQAVFHQSGATHRAQFCAIRWRCSPEHRRCASFPASQTPDGLGFGMTVDCQPNSVFTQTYVVFSSRCLVVKFNRHHPYVHIHIPHNTCTEYQQVPFRKLQMASLTREALCNTKITWQNHHHHPANRTLLANVRIRC